MARTEELSDFQRGTVIGCHLSNKSVRQSSAMLEMPRSTVSAVIVKWKRLGNVACGMLSHSSSMAVQSCWILVGTGNAVVHVDPEHPKHAQWLACLMSMQAMEEMGHFQLPGIMYRSLQHRDMHYNAET